MRPLKLTMNFFGPYRYEQVDFTKFDQSSMFLISGPTGAGKSTIFDGLVFALYGTASGSQREVADFRSEFAADSDETSVELTFTHRNRFYRVIRKPEQVLAKKRGQGTTKRAAQVELTVYQDDTDEKEERQYTKIDETNIFLTDLLQLNAAQFRQIVLLPQGEFRMFLNGDSNQKEDVLRNLFQTRRYERWVDQLQDKYKQARQQNIETQQKIQALLQQIDWPEDDEEQGTPSVTVRLQQLLQQIDQSEQTLKDSDVALRKLSEQSEQKQNHLTELQQIQKLFQQRTALESEEVMMRQQEPTINQLKQQINLAKWAEKYYIQYSELQQLELAINKIQQQIADAKLTATGLEQQLNDTQKQQYQLQSAEADQTELNQKVIRFSALQPLYRQVDQLVKQQAEVSQNQQLQAKKLAKVQAQLTAVQENAAQINQAQQELPDFYQEQHQIDLQQQRLTGWQQEITQLLQNTDTITQSAQQITQLKTSVNTRHTEYDQALSDYQQTKSDYAYQQILILRKDLIPDQACPVCGSTEHPAVLTASAESSAAVTVSEQSVELADQKRQTAAKKLEQSKNQLEVAQGQQEKLVDETEQRKANLLQNLRLIDTFKKIESLDEIKTWLQEQQLEISSRQTRLVDQQATADQQAKQLTALKKQAEELTVLQNSEQDKTVKLQQALIIINTQLADKKKQLPTEFATLAALNDFLQTSQQQINEYQQQVDENGRIINQLQQQEVANQTDQQHYHQQLDEQKNRYNATKKQLGVIFNEQWATLTFEQQLDQFIELLKTVSQIEPWQQQVSDFEQQITQTQTLLVNLQTQLQDYDKSSDVAEAQTALDEIKQQLNQQIEVKAQLKTQMAQQRRIYQQVGKLLEQIDDLSELQILSEVTRGNGSQKLGLERYVLRTYLREVLLVANKRLERLTEGRYRLMLAQESGTTRKNSGLELDVFDDYVGHQRSVRTLSGGESFVTALALALALGEVVQQQTGAIEINALFVDEGFGSLDENALNEAIDALMSLESQQRMIGIISHVHELQTQIPDQLKVISNGGGESRIEYQVTE